MAASLGDTVLEVGVVETGVRKRFAKRGSRLRRRLVLLACAHDDNYKRENPGPSKNY